ncbi:MAG: DNA-directed RNA polymerase subunit alpha [bacterium]|nr:DNA-directed RNA polymerase subunit alpha [bacterium]
MEPLQLPKTNKFTDEEGNKSVFVLEPCYPGYGVTIGNTIRRVLLSSLPGAAVTAVKIIGIDHEFSTIPNVKEDVVEIILNLKQLCIRSYSAQPVRLTLKAKGDKEITAAMIGKSDQIEIVNPDHHIATLDGKGAELEMELIVEQGRGYVPVEAREDEKQEIGMISIDAIYTPVRNVNFTVENVRVGKMTNYDKLTLFITTNGTITGRDALDQAAKIAVDHFKLLMKESFESVPQAAVVTPESLAEEEQAAPSPVSETSSSDDEELAMAGSENEILALNLSKRAYNALIKNSITTLEQLKKLTDEDLKNMRGLGDKSITEILKTIQSL